MDCDGDIAKSNSEEQNTTGGNDELPNYKPFRASEQWVDENGYIHHGPYVFAKNAFQETSAVANDLNDFFAFQSQANSLTRPFLSSDAASIRLIQSQLTTNQPFVSRDNNEPVIDLTSNTEKQGHAIHKKGISEKFHQCMQQYEVPSPPQSASSTKSIYDQVAELYINNHNQYKMHYRINPYEENHSYTSNNTHSRDTASQSHCDAPEPEIDHKALDMHRTEHLSMISQELESACTISDESNVKTDGRDTNFEPNGPESNGNQHYDPWSCDSSMNADIVRFIPSSFNYVGIPSLADEIMARLNRRSYRQNPSDIRLLEGHHYHDRLSCDRRKPKTLVPEDLATIDISETPLLEFTYRTLHVVFKCNLSKAKLPNDLVFYHANCVYPGALKSRKEYSGSRWTYERECNVIAWKIVSLNPHLYGHKGAVQKAVNLFRNASEDPIERSQYTRSQQARVVKRGVEVRKDTSKSETKSPYYSTPGFDTSRGTNQSISVPKSVNQWDQFLSPPTPPGLF